MAEAWAQIRNLEQILGDHRECCWVIAYVYKAAFRALDVVNSIELDCWQHVLRESFQGALLLFYQSRHPNTVKERQQVRFKPLTTDSHVVILSQLLQVLISLVLALVLFL